MRSWEECGAYTEGEVDLSLNSVHHSGEGVREERGGAGEEGYGWNGMGGEGRQLEERAAVGQGRDEKGKGETRKGGERDW